MRGARRGGPVILDLQCTQASYNRARGIPRYAYELSAALVTERPDLVGRVLLNPALAPPAGIEPLLASGTVAYSDAPHAFPDEARIFHSLSPFDLLPLEQIWPREVSRRGMSLAVTAYDLIPELHAHHYLKDAGLRRRYRTRLQLLRVADRVLAISQTAAAQVVERLELDPAHVPVVGTGTASRYRPPASRAAAAARARPAVDGLERDFVLYTGGADWRKNIEGLVRAYAALPLRLRKTWQLVVTCEVPAPLRESLQLLSRVHGVGDRVLITGFTPDDVLVSLYQSAGLVVFPSIAEGYGLPVAEALACGAPTIASDIPAMAEQLAPDQRFDPTDDAAITAALRRALADDAWRAELGRRAGGAPTTWADVAGRAAAVYEEMLTAPRHPWRQRRVVAFVSPLPPASSGIADHSLRLTEELARRDEFDVDVFADGVYEPGLPLPVEPRGTLRFRARSMPGVEALRGGYDDRVYALGNSGAHVVALEMLRQRPGVVVSHDVRLSYLYAFGSWNPAAVPDGLAGSVQRLYGNRLPGWVGRDGWVEAADEDRYAVLMAREVIGLADRYLVTSRSAQALAALDAGPYVDGKIGVLRFAMELPVPGRSGFEDDPGWGVPTLATGPAGLRSIPDDGAPVVAAFGIVAEVRQPLLLVDAFAAARERLGVGHLAFVGPCSEPLAQAIVDRAETLGAGGSVIVSGTLPTPSFLEWLRRATVAVQLRGGWNGEASATVAQCLLAGLPTLVSDVGWARELPDACVVKLPPEVTGEELGRLLASVACDDGRREALREAALTFAPELSYALAARDLAAELFIGRKGYPPAR